MPRWTAIRVAIAALLLVTLGIGARHTTSARAYATDARARSVVVEFFRSQNERQYDRTCRLLSHRFYTRHRLPDRPTCVALLRVSFMWSGPIEFRIGAVERNGDVFVVRSIADGAPGRIVLARESGDLKVLSVQGG